jgi:acetaldehyde dehydrogenase
MSIPVAILGTGNIARDLFRKIQRSEVMDLALVAGRSSTSDGLAEARYYSKDISTDSIDGIVNYGADRIKIVFDTTSAEAHKEHHVVLVSNGIKSIDLTPSGCGKVIIPAVNIEEALGCDDISLVSCGGQASIPIICALTNAARRHGLEVDYVELTTSVSTLSVGPATRLNVDDYILHTEEAISFFSRCFAKVILCINPAEPPVNMQNSISIRVRGNGLRNIDWMKLTGSVSNAVRTYAPGWLMISPPSIMGEDRLFVSVTVTGKGDYLPSYSGNLDIITSAAVRVGEYILCQN